LAAGDFAGAANVVGVGFAFVILGHYMVALEGFIDAEAINKC
jgi:hypothetical protein